MGDRDASSYHHLCAGARLHHNWLLPTIDRVLESASEKSVFEIGFGTGAVAHHLREKGFKVCGIEPSDEGVALAHKLYPELTGLHQGSAYDALAEKYGTFPVVLSLEVVEHLYAPRSFVATVYSLLKPGGILIISTPYHGYLKNLAIALAGKFDQHFDPLWDHGHIKFWSPRTLRRLLTEGGLRVTQIFRVGRIPPLAKSMIVTAVRPPELGARI